MNSTSSNHHPETAAGKDECLHATLEQRLGYRFSTPHLLLEALTHRSYAHETRREQQRDNERFEFLGDAVLDLAVAHLLMEKYPTADEGALSRLRARVVSERSLARVARQLQLGDFLLLGRGEESTGGRQKSSLLADGLEAVFAAVYLDGGFAAALQATARLLGPIIEKSVGQRLRIDAKSKLQEHIQARFQILPQYRLCGANGPEHAKRFEVEVLLWGRSLACGQGKTKKEAEQTAARALLDTLKNDELDLEALAREKK
jgi:ribonuclease-3